MTSKTVITPAKSVHYAYVLNFINDNNLCGPAKLLDIVTESHNEYALIRADKLVRDQLIEILDYTDEPDNYKIINENTFMLFVSPFDLNESCDNVITLA